MDFNQLDYSTLIIMNRKEMLLEILGGIVVMASIAVIMIGMMLL